MLSRAARNGEAGESRGLLGSAATGSERESGGGRSEGRAAAMARRAQSRINCLRRGSGGWQTVVGA